MLISSRQCPHCGISISALDRFCGACGSRVSRLCPRCEHDVANDLPFCNYCGQPLAPVEPGEPMSRTDQIQLLYRAEVGAFEDKLQELQKRLTQRRQKALRKRGIELAVFFLVLAAVAVWGAPFLERTWNAYIFSLTIPGPIISFLLSVLVILVVGYAMQVRQSSDNAKMDELRARMMLTRERLEETLLRQGAWKDKHQAESGELLLSGSASQATKT